MYSADRLRRVLRVQGRTVNWLAEMTDYTPETVSRFHAGSWPISERFAERAARALGIPLDFLAGEIEEAEAADVLSA